MRSQRITVLVELSLTVALAAVLSLLALRLPINFAGGSISFAMLPILILGLRRGFLPALFAGLIFGSIDYIIEPYFVDPRQVVLDYPIAYGALALSGLGSGLYRRAQARSAALGSLYAAQWMAIGGIGRFAAAWTSGVVFFGANAPAGQPVWLYSIIYNASYLAPSLVMCIAAALIIMPVLERTVPAAPTTAGATS